MKNLLWNLKSKKVKQFIKKWNLKTQPIAVSVVTVLLLTVGCHKRKEGLVDAPPCGTKKRQSCQPLSLKAVSEQNVHGCWQGKSAPYLNAGGFSIEGDFIYWRVDEDGLDYVMTSNASSSDSRFHKPEISWDPGFKFGIGYTWGEQDFWDLFLRWTHLNAHQDGEKNTSDPSHVLIPVWSPTVLGQQALNASVAWQVRYNTLDLEMGRDYFISKTVALRPHIGLRGATILQHYEAKYRGVLNTTLLSPLFNTHIKAENNFRGIGARAGAQLKWHFTSDWSVIGSVAGSLLYGRYNLNQKLDGVRGLAATDFGFKDAFSKVAANLEASLGFEWECFFSDEDYRFAISAAYEFSEWFSQNRMKQFNIVDNSSNTQTAVTTVGVQNGDLGLQGATLQVRFDF